MNPRSTLPASTPSSATADQSRRVHRRRRGVLIAALTAVFAAVCALPAAPPPGQTGDVDLTKIPLAGLADRLAALEPAKPREYFLLAEELAAEALGGNTDARDLAEHLYVLAFELDRADGSPTELAASCVMGLAALVAPEHERRWLVALTLQLPTSGEAASPAWLKRWSALNVPDKLAFDLATALGLIRSGEGRRAERLFNQTGADQVLRAFAGVMTGVPGDDPVNRLRRQMEQWPRCPECRNRRVVVKPEPGTKGGQTRLCAVCAGLPGPRLSNAEFIGHLRMEAALLRGIQRLWSAQALADGGRPLRDPEPAALAPSRRMNSRASVFQNGQWVEPANAPAPTAPVNANPAGGAGPSAKSPGPGNPPPAPPQSSMPRG
jgi:hypothetical protein